MRACNINSYRYINRASLFCNRAWILPVVYYDDTIVWTEMVPWDGYFLLNSVAAAMMHFHNDFKKNRTTNKHEEFDWNQLNRLGSLNCRYSTKAPGLEGLFRCWWRYSYKATRPTNTAREEYHPGLSGFHRWEHLSSFYFKARENRPDFYMYLYLYIQDFILPDPVGAPTCILFLTVVLWPPFSLVRK